MRSMPLQLLSTARIGSAATAHANLKNIPSDTVFRWNSSGGGWRSMFACAGFANVYQQAGLFAEDGSRFDAIATTSGATWFSPQLLYWPFTTKQPSQRPQKTYLTLW